MSSQNKISAVVFDWAGTTVDYGSSAPSKVFDIVFSRNGIKLTLDEINGPMGMEKKAHIRSLLSLNSAKQQWFKQYGKEADEKDVQRLYEEFEATLYEIVADYSKPIEGVLQTVIALRTMGIKIGSTTGYNSQMMEKVIPAAKQLGYNPDCVVTPDMTGGYGRPSPFMLFECMRQLNVYPPKSVVKVGDTVVDILEGVNAGAISVGVLKGSNLLGLSETEYEAMSYSDLKAKKEVATKKYLEAGADYVLDSISDLPQLINKLNENK